MVPKNQIPPPMMATSRRKRNSLRNRPRRRSTLTDFSPDDDANRVSRFDGESWSHYLEDLCIYAIDAARDGSIWLQAGVPKYEDQTAQVFHTYVITPEAYGAPDA